MAVATYGPILILHAACISGRGFWSIRGVEFFMVVPVLSLPMAIVALAMLPFRRRRRLARSLVIIGGGLALLLVPAVRASAALRSHGFSLAARRAEPLVAAIRRVCNAEGHAPIEIADLVPRYLAALPEGLPPLELVSGEDVPRDHYGNMWCLRASVPTGFVNFDEFLYFPNGNYPSRDYGGWIERIDGWGYVHE